jgi:hypothetical protein
MRVYVVNQSVPASTLAAAPLRVPLVVNERHVVNCQMDIQDAAAAAVLAVRIKDRDSLFWPAKGSIPEWISAITGQTVDTRVHWKIMGSDFSLMVEFVNNDAANAHVVEVRITVDDYPLEEIQLRILQRLDTLYKYLQLVTGDNTIAPRSEKPRIERTPSGGQIGGPHPSQE